MFGPYLQQQDREFKQYRWQHEIQVLFAAMAGKCMWYPWWWQHAQPQLFYQHSGKTYRSDRRFERLLQWWRNTLWWQKTCAAICDNPFSIILTLSHSLQSMITMINTVRAKQGANNSFRTNNYSGIPTQHTKTGEWHWETLCWSSNSF